MEANDFLLIIDGSSLLSTQFYGNLPREILMAKTPEDREKFYYKIMKTSKGVYTNGVYGFLRTLFGIIDNQKPKYIAITWDVTRDTFRRELYPEYKGNRSKTMEPLSEQFDLCREVLGKMGFAQYYSEKFEADDYSGSIANKFKSEIPVRIMTKDHDYLQLVDDKTNLWLLVSDQTKADAFYKNNNLNKANFNVPEKVIYLDTEYVNKEFGVYPESIASLKGLMGDSADNIKGVPGIGDKTATALISYYKNIENLYKDINNCTDPKELALKWKNELGISRNPYNYLVKTSEEELVGEKAARLSEKLATIITDIEIPDSLDKFEVSLDSKVCQDILNSLEINSIKIPGCAENSVADSFYDGLDNHYLLVDNFGIYMENIDSIKKNLENKEIGIAFCKEANEITAISVSSGAYNVCIKAEGFILSDVLIDDLSYFAKNASHIFSYDFKELYKITGTEADFTDCGIIHYLLDPLNSIHDGKVCLNMYNHAIKDGVDSTMINAYSAIKLKDSLINSLKSVKMYDLYTDIEKPLVKILGDMELSGIKCSRDELKNQCEGLTKALSECENEIFELAGEKFNILSPKQLGEILFVKLGIPGGKKTKTGYSTGADVLEKLEADYPIVKKILYYRQLSKLLSTYIEGLDKCIASDGRIHCTFKQTVTATGRLSCTEPNLQNIPVRDELGRRIRKAFVPEDGMVFVDADYSQIELRILAHMAGDEKLLEDYKEQRDIHQSTASNVFGVPYEEVTKEMRRNAKAVNFGIVYGISSFGLGQDLDISRKQAQEYIEAYFNYYPGVKKFLDNMVSSAKKDEQVKTLYGRIRPIPEISSSNFMQRSFGERIAMNSPIQGTAADIMKISMIRVYNALKEAGLKSKILLQIHDEILIEAYKDEVDAVKDILVKEMKNAAKLEVELEVAAGTADNWYDLK